MCKIRLRKGVKTTVNIDIHNHGLRIVAPDDDTILDLEPLQGLWTQAQYIKLTDHSQGGVDVRTWTCVIPCASHV